LDRLSSQFTAILDVSEAEAGVLALQFEKVSLDDLARDVLETFQPVALDRALRLEAAITPGMLITGDRGRLFQVLANLLDNALKYTATGGRVRLSVEPDGRGAGTMVSVADDGVGIAEKDLPHIFERYYRGDENRSGPGAGLGLPLVQGVVEAHGGKVTVESELGKGSTFRVFLPRDMKP
jgi:signal transduction histidine kinase